MKFVDNRSTKLSANEIEAFRLYDLPYRIKILETLVDYPNKVNTDPYWPSIYESAQITCRMFIQFFGLGVSNHDASILEIKRQYFSKDGTTSTEVKIVDLKGDFVALSDLTSEDKLSLAHAYEAGSRATAHLNYQSQPIANPIQVIKAARVIRRLIREKLRL